MYGCGGATSQYASTDDSTVGPLEFNGGYPTEETIEIAFDILDKQRATQAYLDFMPIASMNALFESHVRDYGMTTAGDVGIYIQQGVGRGCPVSC